MPIKAAEPQHCAFVLGNSEYTNSEFPLIEYAERDASRTFKLLTNSASSIFDPKMSMLKINVKYSEFDDILGKFFEPISQNDLVLIYFAGHAKTLVGKKRLFLTMTNTEPNRLARTAFDVDGFLPYLEEKNINRYVVILDCCRAGTALESPGVRHRGLINNAELQNLSGRGKVFIASSLHYQLANELENLKHGLFSNYFIQGIESGDAVASSKRYVNVTDLCSYVQRMIKTEYPDLGQEPIMDGSDVIGDLHIALNVKYRSQDSHLAELQEYIKRTLDVEDLSDKGKLHRARIRKLRTYFEELAQVETGFESTRSLAILYGDAVGLSKQATNTEFNEFAAAMKFNTITVPQMQLPQLNAKGNAYLFSAAYRYYAYESQELGSSLFTYYLCEALTGLVANERGLVTLSTAYNYVSQYIQDYDRFKQKPFLVANKMTGDLVLSAEGVDWEQFRGKRHAILIGVGSYEAPELSSLRYSRSDAEKLATVLSEKGGFECMVLADATYMEVMSVLVQKLDQLEDDDFIVIYFTGHGFSVENEGYAALSDSVLISGIFTSSLRLSVLSQYVNTSRAGTSLVILDACMSPADPSEVLMGVK